MKDDDEKERKSFGVMDMDWEEIDAQCLSPLTRYKARTQGV